jgi:type IV pilus assembly protein PilC
VPQIATLFKSMGMALPGQTRAARRPGFMAHWLMRARRARGRRFAAAINANSVAYLWDYTKLRLPVIGPILQKIVMSRFTNVFS